MTYSSKTLLCPICQKDHGCNILDDGAVLCLRASHLDTPTGYRFIKSLSQGMGSLFIPSNSSAGSYPTPLKLSKHSETPYLDLKPRDRSYRFILKHLPLKPAHLDHLSSPQRGLTPQEIQYFGFRSWDPHLPFPVHQNLAGIHQGQTVGVSGIFLPAYNPQGQITGAQIKTDQGIPGKYIWLSSATYGGAGPHLPNGKLPLFVYRQPQEPIEQIWLVEGALKAAIVAAYLWRLGLPIAVIGASGAHFDAKVLTDYLPALNPQAQVILAPDAGMLSNRTIDHNYQQVLKLCQKLNYPVSIAWWNQFQSTDPDLDDLLIQGQQAQIHYLTVPEWERLHPPKTIKAKLKTATDLTPTIDLNERYLSSVNFPDQGLIGIRSAKGTGKTQLLNSICAQTERVLYIGHRVALINNSAGARLGLITYQDTQSGFNPLASPQLAISLDSLHKLPTDQNRYHTIILDEVEQVLDHLCNSSTLKQHRHDALLKFSYFIASAQRVICLDADLSANTLTFLQAIRQQETPPHIIINRYLTGGRQVYCHAHVDSLTQHVFQSLDAGEKPYLFCASKKEAKRLEHLIQKRYPQLRLRVIHGDNSMEPDNQAFIQTINQQIPQIDCLITTASLGTGISIDISHFTQIYGFITAATLSATEISQGLHRVRGQVPVHLFVTTKPPQGGYQSEDPQVLKQEALRRHQETGILLQIDLETGAPQAANPDFLTLWAQIKAKRHRSLNQLQTSLFTLLLQEGHQLTEINSGPQNDIKQARQAASLAMKLKEAEAIAFATNITLPIAQLLDQKPLLSYEQRCQLKKFYLQSGYGLPVTPELVLQDDDGHLLSQLAQLDDLLSKPEVAMARDLNDRDKHQILTDQSHYTLKRSLRVELGLAELVSTPFLKDQEQDSDYFTPDQLATIAERARSRRTEIKRVLNLTIPPKAADAWIVGQLLQQLGLKTKSKRVGPREARQRLYRLETTSRNLAVHVIQHRQNQRQAATGPQPSGLQQQIQDLITWFKELVSYGDPKLLLKELKLTQTDYSTVQWSQIWVALRSALPDLLSTLELSVLS